MSGQAPPPPQLPPTAALEREGGLKATAEKWFDYPVRVQPHHTDYSGVVWHGTYLTWMEEARVECLRSMGIDFAELVRLGCDLPVVELSVRYHRAARLGETVAVRTCLKEVAGVRMNWDYRLESPEGGEVYLSARVTLVAVDREKGKILRQLPPGVKEIFVNLLR